MIVLMKQDARRLLDRIEILRNVCDLDLLVFFIRHPRTLLSSEVLATFLGYDLKAIADSLDVLLAGGLLNRKQSSAHAARLYVLSNGGANEELFAALLDFASTRPGRLVLKQTLEGRSSEGIGAPVAATQADNVIQARRLPIMIRRKQRRPNAPRAR